MESRETLPPSGDSHYRMIDVGDKPATHRVSQAEGRIYLTPAVFQKVAEKTLPKGDALALAEVAGIMAAKKTPEILPLCHPLSLDKVQLTCHLEKDTHSVRVVCEAATRGPTGVEMEALTAVAAGLLCIYDLTKMFEPLSRIGDIRLLSKSGGKSGDWTPGETSKNLDLKNIFVAVVTISDSVSRGVAEDRSGPALTELAVEAGAELSGNFRIADEATAIQNTVKEAKAQIIFTTGGTGAGPRDVTIQTLSKIARTEMVGLGELLRTEGRKNTPRAVLSNSSVFLVDDKVVVCLPGSEKAAREGFSVVLPLLKHVVAMAKGERHG